MGWAENLFSKPGKDLTIDDIEALVKTRREENANLEYKGPSILDTSDELSQWVSALLNAEGGVIIVGVLEDNPQDKGKEGAKVYPQDISYVNANKYPRERVDQLVHNNVRGDDSPTIHVYPVRAPNTPSKAIYLLDVPQGENPPYQAADKKYYRRLNTTKYPMMHYEIVDFLGRRKKPKLSLEVDILDLRFEDSWHLTLRFFIKNTGRAVAKYTRLTAEFFGADIVSTPIGNIQRIDDLRSGHSSVQYDDTGVIHPTGKRVRVADINFKLTQSPFQMKYDLVAEDVDLQKGTADLTYSNDHLQQLKTAISN